MNCRKWMLAMATLAAAPLTAHAGVIAAWDFDAGGVIAAPVNAPSDSSGTGSATQLGMTNSYTYATGEGPGSVANGDVLASAGASTGSGSFAWRVRGNGNAANSGPGVAHGWNSAAPIATQGAQFSAPITGSTAIFVSADINATGQAERNLAILYTLDDTVTSPAWVNATITSAGTLGTLSNNVSSASTISGNYVQLGGTGTGWNNQILASIPTISNDPNFAIEIVNASTGTDSVNTSGAALNNSSGNWRFDNIIISSTPIGVPEPGTLGALAAAGVALLARRRK